MPPPRAWSITRRDHRPHDDGSPWSLEGMVPWSALAPPSLLFWATVVSRDLPARPPLSCARSGSGWPAVAFWTWRCRRNHRLLLEVLFGKHVPSPPPKPGRCSEPPSLVWHKVCLGSRPTKLPAPLRCLPALPTFWGVFGACSWHTAPVNVGPSLMVSPQ